MPKICYVKKRFSSDVMSMIDKANEIISEYGAQGFSLTLRQLYYQFVARDIIPNNVKSYKNLGSWINDARLSGLIDWDHIQDRTRNLKSLSHWDAPGDVIESAASSYHIDMWERQKFRPQVWIEKDALVGVIEDVCEKLDVPYFSCRGYTSQSEMWAGARRLLRYSEDGQTPIIFHFGDHDPSGRDMTRDIQDRMEMFMGGVELKRLALNMDQIEKYNPPPNPAKTTDTRAKAYITEFGNESWELDALEPKVITNLIETKINELIDHDVWDEDVERYKRDYDLIREAAGSWDSVVKFLHEKDQ